MRHQSITKTQRADALFSQSGQVVATVTTDKDGTRFAKKRISSTKHALRTPPALAVDSCVLDQAEAKGCAYFRVYDQDTNTTYQADLATFKAHGFDVNRGFGKQVALTFAFWSIIGPDGTVTPKTEPKPINPKTDSTGDLFAFGEVA